MIHFYKCLIIYLLCLSMTVLEKVLSNRTFYKRQVCMFCHTGVGQPSNGESPPISVWSPLIRALRNDLIAGVWVARVEVLHCCASIHSGNPQIFSKLIFWNNLEFLSFIKRTTHFLNLCLYFCRVRKECPVVLYGGDLYDVVGAVGRPPIVLSLVTGGTVALKYTGSILSCVDEVAQNNK